MKELVVISGKGGTGKTSVVGAFAALAEKKVLADCDVDAADLHLLLKPTVKQQGEFRGGSEASIDPEKCTGCGTCVELCRFGAIHSEAPPGEPAQLVCRVDPISCEGCGVCTWNCPENAIAFEPQLSGQWFISETRHGPMVHAKLGIAQENSGKLVTLVRNHAKRVAEGNGLDLIIVDGAPGIGCPVIASVTGASLALVVTEPTLSGIHDLKRVCQLTAHFQIPTIVCVNKYDLNPDMADSIEEEAKEVGAKVVGRIRYDPAVTKAQILEASIVEYTSGAIAQEVQALWRHVVYELG